MTHIEALLQIIKLQEEKIKELQNKLNISSNLNTPINTPNFTPYNQTICNHEFYNDGTLSNYNRCKKCSQFVISTLTFSNINQSKFNQS